MYLGSNFLERDGFQDVSFTKFHSTRLYQMPKIKTSITYVIYKMYTALLCITKINDTFTGLKFSH